MSSLLEGIITITAYGGAGKTEVAKALAEQLNSTLIYHFDEIDGNITFPKNHPHAEANEYNLDKIFNLLEEDKLKSTGFIIFDYPFGRCHKKLNSLIDFAVYIDVPLDIAMSRRILRDLDIDRLDLLPQLLSELRYYEPKGREAYLSMERNIKPSCDLVVDGTKPIKDIVEQIVEYLNENL